VSAKAPAVQGFGMIVIDCHNALQLAQFWVDLLGGSLETDDEGDAFVRAPGIRLDFLNVPDEKVGKNRLHIDIVASDVVAATQQAVDLGATIANDVHDGARWQVMRDPEGNEFCILPPELG
jgi:Glyoxalase-like domain